MARDWKIDDFELGRPLGRGKFGQVWLARDKENKNVVALKIIQRKHIRSAECTRQLRREIEIHSKLKSPNILRMYGYFYDALNIYFVLEYAGNGEFFKLLNQSGKFSEKVTAEYILQVSYALQTMHSLNVIHRDIKPENLMLGCDNKVKVIDFGWSVRNCDKKRKTYCGTIEYLAPEMHKRVYYDESIDMWCLGVLCYEFLVGNSPFQSKTRNTRETFLRVKDLNYEWPENVSEEAKRFVNKLIVLDPSQRINARDVANDEWIVKHCGKKECVENK